MITATKIDLISQRSLRTYHNTIQNDSNLYLSSQQLVGETGSSPQIQRPLTIRTSSGPRATVFCYHCRRNVHPSTARRHRQAAALSHPNIPNSSLDNASFWALVVEEDRAAYSREVADLYQSFEEEERLIAQLEDEQVDVDDQMRIQSRENLLRQSENQHEEGLTSHLAQFDASNVMVTTEINQENFIVLETREAESDYHSDSHEAPGQEGDFMTDDDADDFEEDEETNRNEITQEDLISAIIIIFNMRTAYFFPGHFWLGWIPDIRYYFGPPCKIKSVSLPHFQN